MLAFLRKSRRSLCLALAAAGLLTEAAYDPPLHAQTAPPTTLGSMQIGSAALISPTQAASYYGNSTTSTAGLEAKMGSQTPTPTPPEIIVIARALKGNGGRGGRGGRGGGGGGGGGGRRGGAVG